MKFQENTIRELSAHELDAVGGGVSGSSYAVTTSPGKSTIVASSVTDGSSSGGSTGGTSGGSSGGTLGSGLLGSLL